MMDDPCYTETGEYLWEPVVFSTIWLKNDDMRILVKDKRTDERYEFLYSEMRDFANKLPKLDKYWMVMMNEIDDYHKRKLEEHAFKLANPEKPLDIKYLPYKKYGKDGCRGYAFIKVICGEECTPVFEKDIEANRDTAKGIYWLHKDVFMDLCNSNIEDIIFRVNGIEGIPEVCCFKEIRSSCFFTVEEFANYGKYKEDKIFISETDLGRDITFKDNHYEEYKPVDRK